MPGPRVLVLENIEDNLDLYVRRLRRAGFDVEGRTNLADALDAIDERTFAVCVIDLMLDDPRTHGTYDGAHLLAGAAHLNEGTSCIILSGQDRPGVAADLVLAYPVHSYVEKGSLSEQGSAVLVEAVQRAADDANLAVNAEANSVWIQMYGGAGVDSTIAETNLSGFLKPRGGISALKRSFALALDPLLPLFGRVAPSSRWDIDPSTGVASKDFWSKGLGLGVQVLVSASDIDEPRDGEAYRNSSNGLTFVAVELPDQDRHEFSGTLPAELRRPIA
ncbi:MAG: hypothetical protein R2701_08430 [Acidimicrobiales bacterium]